MSLDVKVVCGHRINVAVLELAFIFKDCQAQDGEPEREKASLEPYTSKYIPFCLEKVGNTNSFFVDWPIRDLGAKESNKEIDILHIP